MSSADDLPDQMSLTDVELLKSRYKLDDRCTEALKLLRQNVPLADIGKLIGEDFWLRQVLSLIEDASPMVKARGLEMLGRYLGTFSNKQKAGAKRVVFESK